MPGIDQRSQGGRPQGGPPVPPQHPIPQGGRQPFAPMGFQQRPVDPRLSQQALQQQPLRPASQPAGHLTEERPYSGFSSPQSQWPYPSFQDPSKVPHSHDDIIPAGFGRFIEVSDLTAATFTQEDYYQYLSTAIVIRFEKIEPQNKYDSAGKRVKSTWLNCTRTPLPNFDAAQAKAEIQRLNRRDNKKDLTLIKKNLSLDPNVQMQVKKAERDLLAAEQDPRFCIILKQLDWTTRSVVKHHTKGSKRHSSKKPQKELAFITAFFSRCPKVDQIPSTLYRQLELEKLQGQTQLDQQRRNREVTAHRAHGDQARENRGYEQMAGQKVRQEETMANRTHQQRMMSQQPSQQMHQPQGRPPVPQHQHGSGPHGQPQGRPPMAPQQSGPLPQGQPQGRPPMAPQQSGPLPQGQPQGRPPMAPQQSGPLPQGQPQGRPPMAPQQSGPLPQGQTQARPPINPQQSGPLPQGQTQARPPIDPQQSGPLPQGQPQARPPMVQQVGPMPQQHSFFQLNNGQEQGRPQQPPNGQGMPPQGVRQMAPQQEQQRPPQSFTQTAPHQQQQGAHGSGANRQPKRRPSKNEGPSITVIPDRKKYPKHKRHHPRHSSSSSDSSSDVHSFSDSGSDRSSISTNCSSLPSSSSGSPRMTKAVPTKPRKPSGGASAHFIVDTDGFVHDARPPVTRRHSVTRDKAYIQTGSDRKIKVPGLSPRRPSVDPLTQVREAYLAGHKDHERLAFEVERLNTSARKYQPDRLDTLPSHYRSRRLSRSDTLSGHRPKIFQDEDVPRIRRMTRSEVGRELNQERARDFDGDFSPRVRNGSSNHASRFHDPYFAARARIDDEYQPSSYDGQDRSTFHERQRQRDSLARAQHEEILRGIGVRV